VSKEYSQIHVFGDFNYPDVDWATNFPNENITDKSSNFCDVVNENFLTQLNKLASRKNNSNILDLVLTNIPDKISNIDLSSVSFKTDHKLLNFTIYTKIIRQKPIKRTVFNFKKANFDNIRDDILNTDFGLVDDKGDVDADWRTWLDSIMKITTKHTPTICIKHSYQGQFHSSLD
jgi:hypothetical protein